MSPQMASPEERAILELRARGLSVREAGARRGMAEATAKALMQRAYLRLGASNLVEALTSAGIMVVPGAAECGAEGRCGRPGGHPGAHGAWRP